jgi:tetratricopeptide (TPR) repeat protein
MRLLTGLNEVDYMKRLSVCVFLFVALFLTSFVYAAPRNNAKQAFQNAQHPAWSVRGEREDLKISVSTTGRTLGMVSSVGMAMGMGVDYVVNENFREKIREALGDYDLSKVVQAYLEERLNEVAANKLRQVTPLSSTAGFNNEHDAVKARIEQLKNTGVDLLLDLKVKYGLYGDDIGVKFEVEGKLLDLSKNNRLWMGGVPAVAEPYFADVKFENAIVKNIPYFHAPKFTVDKDKIKKLTDNNADLLKKQFESAVRGGVSAVLCDMGIVDEPMGRYFLGREAFQKKKYDKAQEHFVRAIELEPNLIDAKNDLSVTYDRLGATDKAIEFATKIVEAKPDYVPALFNLAWWNAFEKKDASAAKKYYEKALAGGALQNKKLEKRMEKIASSK